MLVAQAYVDDSGKSEPPVYVLAGFVATAKTWAAFSDDWKEILSLGPLPLKYFKMAEAASCESGQFRFWSEERRNERVNQLVAVIKRHLTYGVCSIIPHKVFEEVLKRRKIFRTVKTPFHLALFLIQVELWMQHKKWGDPTRVDFIFDKEILTQDMRTLYEVMKNGARPEMKALMGDSLIEGDDKDFMPLQAADMLAWKVRRHMDDKLNGRPVHWPWTDFYDEVPVYGRLQTRQDLENYRKYITPPPGKSWDRSGELK
jgi:Protein of unknown function (DUF3800)